MQRADRHKIDKTPSMCKSPEELMAGDILIFNYNPAARHLDSGGFMTLHNQGFLNERGGHRTSVHSGFIIDTPEGKKLAHVVGKGLQVEPLDSKFFKRTVHIYRPRRFRQELAAALKTLVDEDFQEDVVKNDDDNSEELLEPVDVRREQLNKLAKKVKKFRWDASVAVRSLVHRIFTSIMIVNNDSDSMAAPKEEKLPDNVISRNTICSKYVADMYISACNRMSNEVNNLSENANNPKVNYSSYFMNISSLTPPKALQAYLYRNTNYDYLVMPHVRDQLYDKLRAVIQKEITRLKSKKSLDAHDKGESLERALNEFEQRPPLEDIMQQSIALLKALDPILKHNTGAGFVKPTSYKHVMNFAKSEGIYPDYIEYELHDRKEARFRALAAKHYHFNPAMAELYRGYRRKGYSDEEARFECKPSFGEWYKLCPARNIFLTCTVIGFFAWVLPHGLTRANHAKKRNAAKEAEVSSRIALSV